MVKECAFKYKQGLVYSQRTAMMRDRGCIFFSRMVFAVVRLGIFYYVQRTYCRKFSRMKKS